MPWFTETDVSPSLVLAFLLAAPQPALALLIDFESIPGGSPADELVISDQFLDSAGVSFALEGGGYPVLAMVGAPTTAFAPDDQPNDAERHGSLFLTDGGDPFDGSIRTLIISYSSPAMSVSADFIDVDFDEAMRVEARDASGGLLEALTICRSESSGTCIALGGATADFPTGDGVTTPWSITREQTDIWSLTIVGQRSQSGRFGLAFDNFDTGITPEPTPTLLLIPVGLALVQLRRR